MTNTMLYTKIATLPPSMLKEVDDFVEFLKSKNKVTEEITERKFGCGKGLLKMHDDFEAPLDDFKEWM